MCLRERARIECVCVCVAAILTSAFMNVCVLVRERASCGVLFAYFSLKHMWKLTIVNRVARPACNLLLAIYLPVNAMIMRRHPVSHFLYCENKFHNVYPNAVFAATFSLLSLPIVCLCGWYCANVVEMRGRC